ncbi:MAG: alpha-ketoglutarate-dependent dioxygenase AlkB [Actinomycetota bacterium]|nr:MAG: alpha-ketoglutarate-dependent dioxygenase AlkB [Actinomycetota bacterium]
MAGLQANLFAQGEIAVDVTAEAIRTDLGPRAWVELVPGWLGGADGLFVALATTVDWQQRRRVMWDREVDEPRLTRWYADGSDCDPALLLVRRELERRYRVPFGAIGLNYYRDGRDSVAWHGDRELRDLDDTIVAIVTLGAARTFAMRPRDGGRGRAWHPASGDLLVMGGDTQATWDHAIPKVATAGPRISISVRWARSPARTS